MFTGNGRKKLDFGSFPPVPTPITTPVSMRNTAPSSLLTAMLSPPSNANTNDMPISAPVISASTHHSAIKVLSEHEEVSNPLSRPNLESKQIAKPLQFTDLTEITFYRNQHEGLAKPSIRDAIENHVFSFAELDNIVANKKIVRELNTGLTTEKGGFKLETIMVESNYFDIHQARFVQSVDGNIYIGREGNPDNDIMHHGGLAKLPSLDNPTQLISNNKCINAGDFTFEIIKEIVEDQQQFHHIEITEIYNRSGAMKTAFNQLQLTLISMYAVMEKNPRIQFAPTISFQMAEWKYLLSLGQWNAMSIEEQQHYCEENNTNPDALVAHIEPLNEHYTIQREDLIKLIQALRAKYEKTLFSPEKLREYSFTQREPVTYTVTESYAEHMLAKEMETNQIIQGSHNTAILPKPSIISDTLMINEPISVKESASKDERRKRKIFVTPATPSIAKYHATMRASRTQESNIDPSSAATKPSITKSPAGNSIFTSPQALFTSQPTPVKPRFAGYSPYSLANNKLSTPKITPAQSSITGTASSSLSPDIANAISLVQTSLNRQAELNKEAKLWENNLFYSPMTKPLTPNTLSSESPTNSPPKSVHSK